MGLTGTQCKASWSLGVTLEPGGTRTTGVSFSPSLESGISPKWIYRKKTKTKNHKMLKHFLPPEFWKLKPAPVTQPRVLLTTRVCVASLFPCPRICSPPPASCVSHPRSWDHQQTVYRSQRLLIQYSTFQLHFLSFQLNCFSILASSFSMSLGSQTLHFVIGFQQFLPWFSSSFR